MILQEAVRLHKSGKWQEAEQKYRQFLQHQPAHPDALHLLGVLLHQKGESHTALRFIQKAISENSHQPLYFNNLGMVLAAMDRDREALAAFTQAINLKSDYAEAYNNRGNIFKRLSDLPAALSDYNNALHFEPRFAEALNNRGTVFHQQGKLKEALEDYETALKIRPEYAQAFNNRGITLQEQGKTTEALTAFDRALQINPDYVDARWNRALALLLTGNFQKGWQEFEWRWMKKEFAAQKKNLPQPFWDGSALNGRTLFLYSEQGAGDNIQFIRFVSMIEKSGGQIIMECEESLASLFATVPGIDRIINPGDPVPDFHVHLPLLSMPHILKITPDIFPAAVPYLFPAPFPYRLPAAPNQIKVGFLWAGNPRHKNDKNRSIDIHHFSYLFNVANIRFFSLQVGERKQDLAQLNPARKLNDLSAKLTDYSLTAAAIKQLDLVISVDTSVAHLAGAIGARVWVLLPFAPDWRWMLHREDSPWYPTMRLFRQPAPGDWAAVFRKLKKELEAFRNSILRKKATSQTEQGK